MNFIAFFLLSQKKKACLISCLQTAKFHFKVIKTHERSDLYLVWIIFIAIFYKKQVIFTL